jgi:SWI/SNF chromatin-remodeling complex subunit SWI1
VARVLQHYYQVILGNFEELYRKNVVEQQRKALAQNRTGAAPQGGPQAGVNGNLQLGQQDTASAVNVMGMMGQPISNAQSTGVTANNATNFPLQPQQSSDHQRQPSATPSMSGATDGASGQTAITGYPAQVSVKPAPETEQDSLSGKRKLESEEADVKRARQKTGLPFSL